MLVELFAFNFVPKEMYSWNCATYGHLRRCGACDQRWGGGVVVGNEGPASFQTTDDVTVFVHIVAEAVYLALQHR